MEVDKVKIDFRLWVIVVLAFVLLLGVALIYFVFDENDKVVNIAGGVVVASFFSIIQVFVNRQNFQEYDNYRALKVKKILSQRDDKQYYKDLVERCSSNLDIMGVSCGRFLADFADEESNDHPLIDILNKRSNLKVRLLVADKEFLPEDVKLNFDLFYKKMNSLKEKYPEKFEFKYYRHCPDHSYVRIDSDVLVGPNFTGVSSKNSPAIHLDMSSEYLDKYQKYFEDVWGGAGDRN